MDTDRNFRGGGKYQDQGILEVIPMVQVCEMSKSLLATLSLLLRFFPPTQRYVYDEFLAGHARDMRSVRSAPTPNLVANTVPSCARECHYAYS